MRNIAIIVFTLLVTLVSCADGERYYSISGTGVTSGDTLYLYGLDRHYDYMDTILADANGEFGFELYADTVFPLTLLMPTGEPLLLYAEPDVKAVVSPDTARQGRWDVKGGNLQQVYDSMAARLENLSPSKCFDEVEEFVRRYPMSEINIMLWRRYMIESPAPNARKIRDVSNVLGGKLKDEEYVVAVLEFLDKKRSLANIKYTSMPVFNLLLMDDSTRISNSRYKEKFLVLNFWASWDSLSREHVKEMSRLSSRFSSDEFAMLNISLDHDTAQWHKAVYADSIVGDNVCDLKIWDNFLVERYNVNSLPYSVLVNPQLLNIEYDITSEMLDAELDSLIVTYKKDKEKKEKRRKKKK